MKSDKKDQKRLYFAVLKRKEVAQHEWYWKTPESSRTVKSDHAKKFTFTGESFVF